MRAAHNRSVIQGRPTILPTTANGDRGCNCVPVSFFGKQTSLDARNPEKQDYFPNLHDIWDTELVERIDPVLRAASHRRGAHAHRNPVKLADELDSEYSEQTSILMSKPVTLDAWSVETHEVAVGVAYKDLPKAIQWVR